MPSRVCAFVLALASAAAAQEKTVLLDETPANLETFNVSPDGSRLYFSAGDIVVADAAGKITDRFGAYAPRGCEPLPDGWFVVFLSHAKGQICHYRPDGTEAKVLVGRGGSDKLKGDSTGWTSPCGGAVDGKNGLIFVLDVTMAPRDGRNLPDPDWSRIAVFGLDGKFIRAIHAFNAYDVKAKDNDDKRTWYNDIEADPERKRLYVTSRRTKEVLAFDYEGKPLGKAPGEGDIAVLPGGRVAVNHGREILLYDSDLKKIGAVHHDGSVRAIEADAQGRLYATSHDASVMFFRWSADFKTRDVIGPRYRKIHVEFPGRAFEAGGAIEVKVKVSGRPEPEPKGDWQVLVRPQDGADLRWRRLETAYKDGALKIAIPGDVVGIYEVAVRFGDGPIALADRARDLFVQGPMVFRPKGAAGSVTVVPDTWRTAYRAGEEIPLHVSVRPDDRQREVRLVLEQGEREVREAAVEARSPAFFKVPGETTARLAPGEYRLRPQAEGLAGYPFGFTIVPPEPDSPLQRILYHEFGGAFYEDLPRMADAAEQQAHLRGYAEEMRRLGFNRQTDRRGNHLANENAPDAWNRDAAPVDLSHPAFAPAAHYRIPGQQWDVEYYLDQAVRRGLRYDTQILGHCDGVKFRDEHLDRLVPAISRLAQWMGRYPSFQGFNYNDEMFFGGWAQGWNPQDDQWLKDLKEQKFKDRPHVEHLLYTVLLMYEAFNKAAREANPRVRTTAAPMWQYPAVEGSYAPVIYEGMDETYSHFLSEGYHYPWYPAHSVEFLRRPGKPMMGVFDNHYGYAGCDGYLQDLFQVLGRGVQGAGAQHMAPWHDAHASDAYRVGNLLARLYGPVFSEFPPLNEAAVLYSFTQDITEGRNSIGTPQYERVFELLSAGMMAGVPMEIACEEDVREGYLLVGGKPRVPMLFLVGLTKVLPEEVEKGIRDFVRAGGKVFTDAATLYGADPPPFQPGDFVDFREVGRLIKKHYGDTSSAYHRIESSMSQQKGLKEAFSKWDVQAGPPSEEVAKKLVDHFNWIAAWKDFFVPGFVKGVELSVETRALVDRGAQSLAVGQRRVLNRLFLQNLFPGALKPWKPAEKDIGQRKLALETHGLKSLYHEGYAAETIYPLFRPVLENLAKELRAAVKDHLRMGVEIDNPWIARNYFDGGAIRYMMLSTDEGAPFPWDGGAVWGLGMLWRQSVLPQVGTMSVPIKGGCAYDVFNRSERAFPIRVDMRSMPGRLFAFSPARLGPPILFTTVHQSGAIICKIEIADEKGSLLKARVPLRIRFFNEKSEVLDLCRGSDADGVFRSSMTSAPGDWSLEVTELLGGKASTAKVSVGGALPPLVESRPDVEVQRSNQVWSLLKGPKVTLAVEGGVLSKDQVASLSAALKKQGVTLREGPVPQPPPPGVYLAVGAAGDGKRQGLFVQKALRHGLTETPVGAQVPGPGRGLITAVYGAAGRDRHAVLVLGGDAEGLNKAVAEFPKAIAMVKPHSVAGPEMPPAQRTGVPSESSPLPRLDDLVGARLKGVTLSGDGKRILVSARGFSKNLALVEDLGRSGRVVQAVRAGEAVSTSHPYVSRDGGLFGASVRTTVRHGNEFCLVDAGTGAVQPFASFGDVTAIARRFGVSSDGRTVITPGPYGAVCWRSEGSGWKEAWAIDYWKEFDRLEWPVHEVDERNPEFQVVVPAGADYALVLFSEKYNQGWIKPEFPGRASLQAVGLAEGKPLWTFEVPVLKQLLFPTLYASPGGRRLLLQVQVGSWGNETYRFYVIEGGRSVGTWATGKGMAPAGIALDDAAGTMALVYSGRLLEVRRPDGSLVSNMLWPHQPVSLAFAGDGKSLYLADDAGGLACMDERAAVRWRADLGCVSYLAAGPAGPVAAGWDGRLRAIGPDGALRWTLDCTGALDLENPMAQFIEAAKANRAPLATARRPANASPDVPAGENLLAVGKAKLTLGGTKSWMSDGKVEIGPEILVNGKRDDVEKPWLHLDEVFWDSNAGRQVYAEIAFPSPADVESITVFENPSRAESWPTDAVIQSWDEGKNRWDTVRYGLFLGGPVNTYSLGLKGVSKVRYVPWSSYYRNFFTCEIEVRGALRSEPKK